MLSGIKGTVTLFLLVLICFSTILVTLSFGLLIYHESNNFMEITGDYLNKEVQNRLTAYYFILGSIDPDLNQQMKSKLPLISHEIFSAYSDGGRISPGDLRKIADAYEIDDIYLINHSGIIYATTFAPDLNFNLSQTSANMGPFLDKMFVSETPVIEDIGISTLTGKLKKYGYYKAPESDTIVEISVDITSALAKSKYPSLMDYIDFAKYNQSIFGNQVVQKYDLYTLNQISQFSLINEGKKFPHDIYEKLLTENPYRVRNGSTVITYTRFTPSSNNVWNPVFNPDYLVSEVWYNFEIPGSVYLTIIRNTLIILGIIIALAFVISSWYFDKKIIRRVQIIIDGLAAIEEGRYDNQITIDGNDELSRIASHINRTQHVIKSKMEDLLHYQIQLEAEIAERKRAKADLDVAFRDLEAQEMKIRTSYENYVESERKFQLLHDNLRDGSVLIDKEMNILEFNSSFEELVGYSGEELTTMRVADLIPSSWYQTNQQIFDHIRVHGYSPLYEEEIVHKNGRAIPIEVQTYVLHDKNQEISGYWSLIRDISERKRLLFQKDQFIIQIAHDLRTPLTPLVGLLPLLHERFTDPESSRILVSVDRVVKDMQMMTEQIIRLAHLNSQFSISDFHERNLSEVIDEAVSMNDRVISERTISVRRSIPPDVSITISQIYGVSIFSNIINNAAKYNVPSGVIEITAREEDSMVVISIADTGMGIAPEIREHIWDELYIGDNARSDPTSKGLGLSIVSKIVRLHGGEISIDSPGVGKGTIVTLKMPKS